MSRYSRQVILPELGKEGQNALAGAHVLVIGAGGLGSPALVYLAAAGVGQLTVVDSDLVDESNLQRQIAFAMRDLGQPKAEAAKRRLLALNPEIRVHAINERFDAANAESLVLGSDIVIDGSDNFSTKFLANDACVKFERPLVYGSISRFEGQVALFVPGGACYRCLYPAPPKTMIRNCAEAGVVGALAGIIGTMQALETIKWIVSRAKPDGALKPSAGILTVFDGVCGTSERLSIPKNPHCPACSVARDSLRLSNLTETCEVEILVQDAKTLVSHGACVLVDVRETDERAECKIEGTAHFPLSSLREGSLPAIDKNARILLHCASGIRSREAAAILRKAGFSDVASLRGGIEAWLHTSDHT